MLKKIILSLAILCIMCGFALMPVSAQDNMNGGSMRGRHMRGMRNHRMRHHRGRRMAQHRRHHRGHMKGKM